MAAEQFAWVDATGASHRLDSNIDGVSIVESVAGRMMPVSRRTDEVVPLQPGQRLRSILHDQRDVTLGLLFQAATATAIRTLLRTWLARFDATRGDGSLVVTDPAGAQRELTCRYMSGLELVEDSQSRDPSGAQLAVVTFTANDPYWADTTDSTQIWTSGGGASTFFPIFPLSLGASQTFGTSTVTNAGDVPTFPVWIIAGPGSDLVLTNLTSGRVLEWAGTLGAAEYLIIDTRPGSQSATPKSVIKNDGSNQFGSLTSYDFWPLEPDANTISIELAGSTGSSQVTADWRARYLGA